MVGLFSVERLIKNFGIIENVMWQATFNVEVNRQNEEHQDQQIRPYGAAKRWTTRTTYFWQQCWYHCFNKVGADCYECSIKYSVLPWWLCQSLRLCWKIVLGSRKYNLFNNVIGFPAINQILSQRGLEFTDCIICKTLNPHKKWCSEYDI